jgi:hypothetical protein
MWARARRKGEGNDIESKLWHIGTAALAALTLALPTGALAQPSGIDPQATKLLKASTDFLAAQKRFSAETRNSLEEVADALQPPREVLRHGCPWAMGPHASVTQPSSREAARSAPPAWRC